MGNEANTRIKTFINEICSYIKNKDVHEEVSDEINDHILEISKEYKECGVSEEEAIERAICRIGTFPR